MLLYDPRFNRKIKTDNPAIVLANEVVKTRFVNPDENFWDRIKQLANYCDFDMNEDAKKKLVKKNLVRSQTSKIKKT